MGLFQRFITALKANLNHLIGRAEDPEKMLNQTLLDMQEQLVTAKRQVAIAIADEKRLAQQFEQERANSAEWERKAMMAVNSSRDDLATQALERKTEHDKLAQGFGQQWQSQKAAVEQLKVALQQLTVKIEDAKRKKNLLVARAKRAEAQKTIQETMSGMSSNSALDTISRMEEKIDRMEAEALAVTEMANEAPGSQLEAEFKKLELSGGNDALLELKAKMGKGLPKATLQLQATVEKSKNDAMARIEEEIKADIASKK